MKVSSEDLELYVVTTRDFLKNYSLAEECDKILSSGATFLQLREKNIEFSDYVKLGKEIKAVADKHNIPFVIDDNVEVALEVDADGVHVGQSDMEASRVREMIGKEKILGVSTQTVEQAIKAEKDGADYLGIGPVFPTDTKPGEATVPLDEVKKISEAVDIPILVIGGIDDKSIYKIKDTGTDGIGVVSYIFDSDNKESRTRKLRELSSKLL